MRGVYCETAMLCPEAEVISTNENADLMTADQSQASNRSSLVVISADLTCHDATMELVVTSLPCQWPLFLFGLESSSNISGFLPGLGYRLMVAIISWEFCLIRLYLTWFNTWTTKRNQCLTIWKYWHRDVHCTAVLHIYIACKNGMGSIDRGV